MKKLLLTCIPVVSSVHQLLLGLRAVKGQHGGFIETKDKMQSPKAMDSLTEATSTFNMSFFPQSLIFSNCYNISLCIIAELLYQCVITTVVDWQSYTRFFNPAASGYKSQKVHSLQKLQLMTVGYVGNDNVDVKLCHVWRQRCRTVRKVPNGGYKIALRSWAPLKTSANIINEVWEHQF